MMQRSNQKQAHAFTLVEMLVVIAIIGIVAGMIIAGAGYATGKARENRARTELRVLELAIENYKDKMGFYPPDNPNDPATPPLFYELLGTYVNNGNYTAVGYGEPIGLDDVTNYFGRRFQNVATTSPRDVRSFFPTGLDPSKYKRITQTNTEPDIKLLALNVPGFNYTNRVVDPDQVYEFTTWRYNSSSPTNNSGKYDLWAEITIRGSLVVIGNWK